MKKWKDLEGVEWTWMELERIRKTWKGLEGIGGAWKELKGLGRTWKDLRGPERTVLKELESNERSARSGKVWQTDRRQKTDGVTDKKIHIFKRKWLISMEGKIINGLPFNSKFSQLNES